MIARTTLRLTLQFKFPNQGAGLRSPKQVPSLILSNLSEGLWAALRSMVFPHRDPRWNAASPFSAGTASFPPRGIGGSDYSDILRGSPVCSSEPWRQSLSSWRSRSRGWKTQSSVSWAPAVLIDGFTEHCATRQEQFRAKPTLVAPQGSPGAFSRHPSATQRDLPVHDDGQHALGILVRLLEGGLVDDRRRVEDDDVGLQAWREGCRGLRCPCVAPGNEDIFRTASSSVSTCFSRTYTPSTRANVP